MGEMARHMSAKTNGYAVEWKRNKLKGIKRKRKKRNKDKRKKEK